MIPKIYNEEKRKKMIKRKESVKNEKERWRRERKSLGDIEKR